MSIGGQRERLELQAPVRSSDTGGGANVTFVKVTDLFGVIMPKSSDDGVFADRVRQKDSATIRIRYRKNISVKNRLKQKLRVASDEVTRIFTIKGIVNVDNRYRYLDLDVEEGVAS